MTITYTTGVTVGGLARAGYCRTGGDSGGPAYYQGIREAENLLDVDVDVAFA